MAALVAIKIQIFSRHTHVCMQSEYRRENGTICDQTGCRWLPALQPLLMTPSTFSQANRDTDTETDAELETEKTTAKSKRIP